MKVADAISAILKREGVEWIIGYPVNHILEHVRASPSTSTTTFSARPSILNSHRVDSARIATAIR